MTHQEFEFYDPHRLLSYNAHFNFIMDVRGRGKTFTFAKRIPIDAFLKSGEQFIYVRRYKEELKELDGFFTDIEHMYPEHEFKVKHRTFYIDNKVMGYAVNLSTANMKKSVAYPHVTRIVYDEFILEKGFVRYLPNEVKTFLNFYETVARTRDNVKVYFLGNSISITNPYFLEFKIIPRQNQRFTSVDSYTNDKGVKEHLILAEIGQDDDSFREMKLNTRFGRIIANTEFAKMSVENQFEDAHDSFIEKKHPKSMFMYSMTYMGQTYGIWSSKHTGKIYVSGKYSLSNGRNYVLTTEEHRPNMILIDNIKKHNNITVIKKAFNQGYLMFENLNIRNSMYDVLKLLS